MSAGIYYALTKDPTPIKIDPKVLDDYAGYYDFGHGYIVAIRREGDRLTSSAPERRTKVLFPETETRFFFKGNPARITFHRAETGRADSVIVQWEKSQRPIGIIKSMRRVFRPGAESTRSKDCIFWNLPI